MKPGFLAILAKIQKSNPDFYAALKELADNIDYNKQLLEGTMRTTGSKNAPNIFRIFDQVSIQAPNPEKTAQYGAPSPYCGLDVNNHIFGLAAAGAWNQTVNIAGLGKYTWDTELYNDPIMFTRINANVDLQCNLIGKYLINATCYVEADGAGVAQVSLFHNTTNVGTDFDAAAGAGGLAMMHFHKTLDMLPFDIINFQNATGQRLGNANRYTELTIYRLN